MVPGFSSRRNFVDWQPRLAHVEYSLGHSKWFYLRKDEEPTVMIWQNRYRVASGGLLAALALLSGADFLAQQFSDTTTGEPSNLWGLIIGSTLLALAVFSAFVDWRELGIYWRSLPAAAGAAALLVGIFFAGFADTSHASIGLLFSAVLILTYIGFVLPPGNVMWASPVLVFILYQAHTQNGFRVGLVVPLMVPIGAILGEIVSALTDRSLRSSIQSTSRTERLGRLEEVLKRFRRPRSLEEAANEVAVAAQQIFSVERATVVLRKPSGGLIPVTLGPSNDAAPDANTAKLVSETIGGDDPRIVETITAGNMLVLPLPAADVPAGAVVVHPIAGSDTEYTLKLARLFGTQVGIAIEHLFVIDELERQTTRDELTGLGNRKHADALLASLEQGDALILLDLDGFKEVNDTYGHAAGDNVLQDVSFHLNQCLRDSDTSARLGGDEFLVVARRAHADPLAVADRILAGWDQQAGTTISAGVAVHQSDTGIDTTFDRADRALYHAKASGKNQAQMWYELETVDPAAS